MGEYAILVNSCDPFEDCWVPYFSLQEKYWPDVAGKIYLNTETKNFEVPGLQISALRVSEGETRRLTWSECLLRALDKIDEEIVLYMQEDYFLKAPVRNDLVEQYVRLMDSNSAIHCIHLTDQSVIPETPSALEGLWTTRKNQRYRVCCQAALWRKDVLRSYLRGYESAWQFEEFGSKRAALEAHNFYVVDPNVVRLNSFEIIPYVFTGIVQGRWKEEVVPLLDSNGIKMDYSRRGFLSATPKRGLFTKLKHFRQRAPAIVRSMFELYSIRLAQRLGARRGADVTD